MDIHNKILELHSKRPIKTILHIGAHLGNEISFYLKLNPEIIYWFEANPELIDELKNNVLKHQSISQKVFQVAVSNENKELDFNLIYSQDMTNTGCSSLLELKEHAKQYPHIKKIKSVKVKAVKLDDFLIENELLTSFDYINMDIQGSEYDVLSTSNLLFSDTDFRIFQLETCAIEMYAGQKIDTEIIDFMNSKGYERIHYHPWAYNWGDSLFMKK